MPANVTPLGGGGDWVPGQPDDQQNPPAAPPPTRAVVTPLGSGSDWAPPARYPDMTPQPKSILDTSFHKLPSNENQDGGGLWSGIVGAASRVASAMDDAGNTPDIVTPKGIDLAYQTPTWLGRNVVGPVVQAANAVASPVVREAARLGAGGTAAASELIGSVLPGGNQQQRASAVSQALTTLPIVGATMPNVGPLEMMPKIEQPETYGPPLPTKIDTSTLSGASKAVDKLYTAADNSDFTLKPSFTDNYVASLDKWAPQTPAGAASASSTNPVAQLVDQLRQLKTAPMDSIRSIQDVDQNIQKAISQNLGDPQTASQMRAILRDFRSQYSNIAPDQYTGSPQGITDFNNARQGYAAKSRMDEVQGIVDSTEGNPNRATLLSSRLNSFLNNKENTAGWNDDEIASLRGAVDTGFVPEWLRAQGSRLVGIGTAVAHGLTGAITAVPAEVGLSYMVRNAAENMRLRQVQESMRLLGQRVPQPNTVAPPPSLMQTTPTAVRYAPLVGLLGGNQPANQ